MKIQVLLFICFIFAYTGNAQVGIGTSTPSSSAALDINSSTRGLLLPRMTFAQRNAISMPQAGLVIWCSNCGPFGEIQVYNGNNWKNMVGGPPEPVIVLGGAYRGGIVAYILQPGDPGYIAGEVHGLIASPATLLPVEWGCYGLNIYGANGIAIGTGNQNTIDILYECSEQYIPADQCADFESGGYSDWYLPSYNELNKLYVNQSIIGDFYPDYPYWASTDWNSTDAWCQSFVTGAQFHQPKYEIGNVRPIRSF